MLRGREVVLRPLTSGEVAAYVAALNDPHWSQTQSFAFVSESAFRREHARSAFLSDRSAVLAIDLATGTHVGFASYYVANAALDNIEIQASFYRPDDDSADRREDIYRLLASYLFDTRRMERVQLLLRPDDTIGAEAALRIGFAREGTLRSMYFSEGEWRDLELYSLLAEETRDA